jgi:hypothetical protein
MFFSLVIVSSVSSHAGVSEKLTEAQKRYYKIEDYYRNWDNGFFGSRNAYEKALRYYLISILGQEIETGYSYILMSPASHLKKKVIKRLIFGLGINLESKNIDVSALKNLVTKDSSLIHKWWRTKWFFKVKGKVVGFHLSKNEKKRFLSLKLHTMKLYHH